MATKTGIRMIRSHVSKMGTLNGMAGMRRRIAILPRWCTIPHPSPSPRERGNRVVQAAMPLALQLMQRRENFFRQRTADPGNAREVIHARCLYTLQAAEMREQRLALARAYA